MKISHESPLAMLEESRKYNDYDYALVHLFEVYPEYLEFFKESLRMGRTVYLDNSIFELGEAFDPEEYFKFIQELQSIANEHKNENFYHIIPDVIENSQATKEQWLKFEQKFGKLGKRIGVAQGETYEKFLECFWFMKEHADIVAIPFNSKWMRADTKGICTKEEEFAIGRISVMEILNEMGSLGLKDSKIHMLGCFVPQEYQAYKDIPEIVSGDTSNPIVHGICGVRYEDNGLRTKIPTKLADLIEYQPDGNLVDIKHNIKKFRGFL